MAFGPASGDRRGDRLASHTLPSMYIDPGAGSLLFQVIAAGAVGVLASVGRIRRAIADFFAKLRGR